MDTGSQLLSLVQSSVAFGCPSWDPSAGFLPISFTQQSHRGQQGPAPCLGEVLLGYQVNLSAPDHLAPCLRWALSPCRSRHVVGSVPLLTGAEEGHAVWTDRVGP